jgi:hypothetical protein
MNARCCQLCGKPLSRLRVGGDGDFCSREHRNQHRLRRGMDRLEEANKVTSLMRRRENPRHISAARLMCNSALEHRAFLEPKPLAFKTETAAFSPRLPGPAAPRIASGEDRYQPPRAARLAGAGASRRAETSRIGINGRATLPLVPPRRLQLPVQIPRAPLVALHCQTPAPRTAPRNYGMLRRGQIRVHLGDGSLVAAALQPRRVLALERETHPLNIKAFALEGNALRVSIGIGFRVAAVAWRDFLSQPTARAALVWPRAPRRVPAENHDSLAASRSLTIRAPARGFQPEASRPIRLSGKPHAAPPPPRRRRPTGQARQRCLLERPGAAFPRHGGGAAFRRVCQTQRSSRLQHRTAAILHASLTPGCL